MIKKKICTKCGKAKIVEEFYKHKGRKDGLQNTCKDCDRIYNQSDKAKIAQGHYRCSEKGKERDERHKASGKRGEGQDRYRKSDQGKNAQRRYRKNNQEKQGGRDAVMYAVRTGKLPRANTQTCTDCEKQAQHYHHESCDKKDWLNVIPLCVGCHHERHRSD